jgi:pyruvate,water dikinase
MKSETDYIRFFDEIGIEDIPLVGGKNASLGEMYTQLTPQGVRVPNGFATTVTAYRHLLDQADAWEQLHAALDNLDPADVTDLATRGARARSIVYGAPLPADLGQQLLNGYRRLREEYGEDMSLAIRSSATAEDLPGASFAGQQDTYLNIKGDAEFLDSCKRCFASLFTDRAIHYRIDQGFDHYEVSLSIGVMKMVRSDLAASGVMFSIDTETGFKDAVFVTGAYGLGENVVQGAVDPDEFYVHKPTFEQGARAVLRRTLGSKKLKMVYGHGGTRYAVRNVPTTPAERAQFCISDEEVLVLADYAIKVEQHYSQLAGYDKPMDMEWAKDGVDGCIYMVQARPETVASQRSGTVLQEYHLGLHELEPVVTGRAVGARIAVGRVRVISDVEHLGDFRPGEVLVSDTTTPDWEPVMKTAAAIVTNRGGRTCHAAIISRELGIPAVVGSGDTSRVLNDGDLVTVCCAEGDVGRVYPGPLDFIIEETDLSELQRPATDIMINLGNPEIAFKTSFLPNDGVGLARMEFIINEYIKAHPMALLYPQRIKNDKEREAILQLTENHASARDYFVQRLSEGVGTIAAAFYPKPVVVRMSDFKSNEYACLLGGRWFEREEENPMIGFRGAARYSHPEYEQGFAMECAAMKRLRDDMGLTNVKLMIPFCRRVDEGERVLATMEKYGLKRGENGLEIYVMCEVPNNVIQLDAFAKLFDGFSIGSNDLTQLILGVDRDSEVVAFEFDEREPGVREMIRLAIEGCRRNQRHSGLCGQAPSDYPEMAEFLVQAGIDSISLNPDVVLKTTRQILQIENQLGRAPRCS